VEARRRQIKRPSLVTATDDYSQSILRGIVSEFKAADIASSDEVEPSLQDFKSLLLKLRNSGSDAIGACLTIGQTSLLARQARGLRIGLPIFGCISLDDPNEWSLAQGKLSGAWYVTGKVDPQFRATYSQRYGNEDVITGAAVHHDVAKLLGDLGKESGTGDRLLKAILSVGHRQGAVGEFDVVSDENDRFLSVPLIVKVVP